MKAEIEAYAQEMAAAYNASPFWKNDNNEHKMRVEFGSKFAKILHTTWGSTCVHCFVEIANGNIHKAATYKAPQKNGLRGNIKDAKRPIFSGDFYVNR